MIAWRSVPLVGVGIVFPPPTASVLFPNPLATGIAPLPAIDRRRRQQEGMLIAIQSYTFANDQGAVVDRLCHGQHLEVAVSQVAKEVEIVHLPFGKEKRVLGVVTRRR